MEMKKKYVKISLDDLGHYIQPLETVHMAIEGELDGAEVGEVWTLEIIEMTEEDYELLPEFEGW